MFVTAQDYRVIPVRAAAILTNSYVAGTVLGPSVSNTNVKVEDNNTLVVAADFTIGSLTDCQIKVEYSFDGTNYYQQTTESVSAGVATVSPKVYKLTATGLYYITITDIKAQYIKISAIGTGTLTSSSLKVTAIVGSV